MKKFILAIDQGTTGTRTYLFDQAGRVRGSAYLEFTQYFPKPGWVEHDPEEIWNTVRATGLKVLKETGVKKIQIAAIGITNQRETVVVWDKKTGKAIHRAIVWQCRRSAARCDQLKKQGKEKLFRSRTGLVIDPYFSASKLEWLLKNIKGARQKAKEGRLAFGTMDTWLLWKLSGGKIHATDYTNASRTLLFNIKTKRWDKELCKIFGVPLNMLPEVKNSACVYGKTQAKSYLGGGIPVAGMVGDQQAALFGQGCHAPGTLKNTYGTGCFLVLNLGKKFLLSKNKLLTTLVCDAKGAPVYGLEGAVFIAGAAIQWVRDGLGLIKDARETQKIAASVPDSGGVYLVPAFVGLGAPYWDAHARGALLGLTRGSGRAQIVRAALESLAYQSRDVVEAMLKDADIKLRELRVDGGASKNDLLMKFQADILNVPINRPQMVETTALGAAFLAGLEIGFWKNASQLRRLRKTDKKFKPNMRAPRRRMLWAGWQQAIARVKTHE